MKTPATRPAKSGQGGPLPAAAVSPPLAAKTFEALFRRQPGGRAGYETMAVNRLVELTFSPAETVAAWAAKIGLKVERQEDGVVILENPGLSRTAFCVADDPVSRAVCLGFAVAGQFWPQVCPGLLEAVNKEWQRRRAQR